MKILIIRLSAMGDTIHTLPVAATFKRNLPDVEISWLVEPLSEPLLRNNPAIDKVFVLHKKEWLSSIFTGPGGILPSISGAWDLVQQLRAQKFDIALDLQGLFKSAIFLKLSGARRRFGLSDTREGARLFIKEVVEVGDWFASDLHVVERNLNVAKYVVAKARTVKSDAAHTNVVDFPLPVPHAQSRELAKRVWAQGEPGNEQAGTHKSMVRNLVLIPGTTWATKLWAPQKWCELIFQVSKEMPVQLCLVGTSLEHTTNSFIESTLKASLPQVRVINLTGLTELLDLIAIFNQADLVVGADTGPLHLAAATGHPAIVGVYGSTPTIRNGPYGPRCHTAALDLWCQPCSEKKCPLGTIDCLRQLPVDKVLKVIKQAGLAQPRQA